MTSQFLMTKSAFAKMTNVGLSTISKALLKSLGDAIVGNKIDINNCAAVEFINKHKAVDAAKKEQEKKIDIFESKESNIEKYMDMSLREILEIFGTDSEFVDWLKAVKGIEDIKEKRIKNEISLGNLIKRDYVKIHVLSLFETVNVRLLNDSPRTIASRVIDAHNSGESRESIETLICELIGVQLKGVKLRVRRALHE